MDAEALTCESHLAAALGKILDAYQRCNCRYAVIGALAVGYRSQFRMTQDLDFLFDPGHSGLSKLLAELGRQGFAFDTETVERQWAAEHMTSISYEDVLVDCIKPVLPALDRVIDTATVLEWNGRPVRVASAEGLIVTKLFSFRGYDASDIASILAANPGVLDLNLIRREWASVADPQDPTMVRFQEIVCQYYRHSSS